MAEEELGAFDLDVIVDFAFDDGLLFITLANIGERPARRVSVTFDPGFHGVGGSKVVSKMQIFRNIEFFAPGKEISVFLDTAASYFAREQPTRISATIRYTDAAGKVRGGRICHDLAIYSDFGHVRRSAE